jgi:DtxR family Mn-dependent transcriptional regulator
MGRQRFGCCAVVHTETVEDYLEAVFDLSGRGRVATTSALAAQLGVAASTVSAMLRRLVAGDLVVRPWAHRIELTEHGHRHALLVVRRRRLVEELLVRVLDVPREEVRGEADALEHAVSDRLVERIDAFLGHPARDPHGDPIPPRHGVHGEWSATSLGEALPGTRFRVERVTDRDPDALRYLGGLGIRPGTELDVLERAPFGGPVWGGLEGRCRALGPPLAELVFGGPA